MARDRRNWGGEHRNKETHSFKDTMTVEKHLNHGEFPQARMVFITHRQSKSTGEPQRHALVIAPRSIALEEHLTAGGLTHVHSENLGGADGKWVAHLFQTEVREKANESSRMTGFRLDSCNDLINRLRNELRQHEFDFESDQVKHIAKKMW